MRSDLPRRTLRRMVRAMLCLYPRGFRREYGEDVVDTHVDRFEAARAAGRLRALGTLIVIGADLAGSALREWWDVVRGRAAGGAAERRRGLPASAVQREGLVRASAQDLRRAVRTLVRQPGFAAAVVATLSLGVGANTAVFSLIDAVLLHPLPVHDPDSLAAIYDASNADGVPAGGSYPLLRDLAAGQRSLTGIAGYEDLTVAANVRGRAALVPIAVVSGEYFGVLGIHPQLGRLIGPDDDRVPLGGPVAVLSDRFWARELGRDPAVLGETIQLGPTVFTIVGVAPRGFRGVDLTQTPEIWVPMTMVQGLDVGGFLSGRFSQNLFTTFRYGWMQMIGRLRAGVSRQDAAADLVRVMEAVRSAQPEPPRGRPPARAVLQPLGSAAAGDDRDLALRFVGLLAGVVALILLLSCSNVANMLLVRSAERTRELGLRAALGANRARLIRQMLFEHGLLAAGGGVVGAAVAIAGMRALAAYRLPGGIAVEELGLSPNLRLLLFTAAVSMLTVLLFGLLPALRASRVGLSGALRLHVRAETGRPPVALVGLQVALSLVILVFAGLFLRSLRAGLDTDVGFDPSAIAAATVETRLHGYSNARAADFYQRVLERLRGTPGVISAAVATHVPVTPMTFLLAVRRFDDPRQDALLDAGRAFVSPGYFDTLSVPLLDGRDFDTSDRPATPLVAMINASAAHSLWPDGRAVGRTIVALERAYTVIGVVSDTKYGGLAEDGLPFMFMSVLQENVAGRISILARTDPAEAGPAALRAAVAAVDAGVAVVDQRRVDVQIERLLAPQRFAMSLLSACGVLALVIAAVGLYASLAHATTRRQLELGIRLALGAPPATLVRHVFARAAVTVALGAAAGLAAAVIAAQWVRPFLIGVTPFDVPAIGGALVVLGAVVAAAACLPARRVVSTDPVEALREG